MPSTVSSKLIFCFQVTVIPIRLHLSVLLMRFQAMSKIPQMVNEVVVQSI